MYMIAIDINKIGLLLLPINLTNARRLITIQNVAIRTDAVVGAISVSAVVFTHISLTFVNIYIVII